MKTGYGFALIVLSTHLAQPATPPLSKTDLARLRGSTPTPPAWYLTGNLGTLPGTHFVGTRDNRPLELKVNGQRVLRLEPKDRGNANILGGSPLNQIAAGAYGSVVAGGGGLIPCEQADMEEDCGDDDALPFYSLPQVMNGSLSFIGGGAGNRVNGFFGVIVGGQENSIQFEPTQYQTYSSFHCAILGGRRNGMTNSYLCSILGGKENRMGGYSDVSESVIGGGRQNHIRYGNSATISGGYNNYIHGQFCAIGGGYANSIESVTGREVIPESGDNRLFSTIPGGFNNSVRADFCFAAGSLANADHNGVFIWSDRSAEASFASQRPNEFAARATGGVRFVTGNGTGVELPPGGGSWASLSDRNAKENLQPVNTREILQKVAALPLQIWNYKTQPTNVWHLGPTSQDFSAAFGLGEDAKHITSIDADGVALAAIQGLHEMLLEKNAEIQQLKTSLAALQEQISAVSKKMDPAR